MAKGLRRSGQEHEEPELFFPIRNNLFKHKISCNQSTACAGTQGKT